jgi:tetratricopeptide (TPR) repeat protein/DNA-binding CsgD family transcriptional regulator
MKTDWKKIVPIFAVILLFSINVFSQSKADTLKIRELTNKAAGYLNTYPDSLLFYAREALLMAERINDHLGIAVANSQQGVYYWAQGDYGQALSQYNISLESYQRMKNRTGKKGSAKMLSNIGMLYSRLGDHTNAIQYFLEALKLAESLLANDIIPGIYNNLGILYKNRNEYGEAANAFERALTLYKVNHDFANVAGVYTNLGNIYQHQNDFDKAITFHHKALHIFDSLGLARGQMDCYNNLGEVLKLQRKPSEAARYYEPALLLSRKHKFPSYEIGALAGLGGTHQMQHKFESSILFYNEAIKIANDKGFRSELGKLYKGLSESYYGLNRSGESIKYFDKYLSIKDSIVNIENATLISNLRVTYDFEKKEADIALLTRENRIALLTRNKTLAISSGIFILLGLLVFSLRQKIKKDRKLMVQQIELQETRKRLAQVELDNQKAREEELNKELDFRSRTLTTYTLNLVQKNGMLDEAKAIMKGMLAKPGNKEADLKKLGRLIEYSFTLDKDWEGFKTYFEQVHPEFFMKLKEDFSELSSTELRLCALIRLSLDVKEAASILNISSDSIRVTRHRIRKKLGLSAEDNLEAFIMSR